MLSKRCHYVQKQWCRERHVHCDEGDLCIHQACDKADTAAKPIKFRDDQRGPLGAAGSKSVLQYWPVVALAGLNLDKLSEQIALALIAVSSDCFALAFDPEAVEALLCG